MNALALYRSRIQGIDTQHRENLGGSISEGVILGGFEKGLMKEGRIELLSICRGEADR